MGFFKPKRWKVFIAIALAISPHLVPILFAFFTPNGDGAYIIFILLPLFPSLYVSTFFPDFYIKYTSSPLGGMSFVMMDIVVDFLLFYLIICSIIYIVPKLQKQKQ